MSVREVKRRLRAWDLGEPIPRFATLHHRVAEPRRVLVVAFVRMAGESRPWGIAWGSPGVEPKIETVPDGRVRDAVASLCANFGEDLLEHMRVHNWTYDPVPKDAGIEDLQQVWVPNGQHLAMFHQLAYAYSQTKFGGSDRQLLNSLGRLSGWLFRDSSRRGSQHIVDASAALREAFSFPAEDARQAHLGFLLAWLTTAGTRDDRIRAAGTAELSSVSPTMNPALERDQLALLLEERRESLGNGESASAQEDQIANVLHEELLRRWLLCSDAYEFIRNTDRKLNPGVDDLVSDSLKEFFWQCQAQEIKIANPDEGKTPFVSHPETDFHGSSAASRYLTFAAADEKYLNTLIHDDAELFSDAVADGRAVRGTVVAVRDEGEGRKTTPAWTVRMDAETGHRIREGGRVVPIGSRKHWATVTGLTQTEIETTVHLEWDGNKTKPITTGIESKPADPAWVGEEVSLVAADGSDITSWRSRRVWAAKDGPGAWLTHGSATAPLIADIASEAAEPILDDVAQIEGPST